MPQTLFTATKLIVGDLNRASSFYCAVAGMTETRRFKGGSHGHKLEEALLARRDNESGLILIEYENEKPAGSNVVLIFLTPDAKAFGDRVVAAGGAILEPARPAGLPGYNVHILIAADPEGNMLEAVQQEGA